MAAIETTVHVDGMTCGACERRVEGALTALGGVTAARASQTRARVLVQHDDSLPAAALKAAVQKAGYAPRDRPSRATPIALGIGLSLAAIYLIANSFGAFSNFPMAESGIGYGMLLVIGLLTSVHCVAMCGGLALSQSVRGRPMAAAREGGFLAKLSPGLQYNGGRVVAYTLVGAAVGGLGSAMDFSPTAQGAITALAGLFMLWLGLKMMGIIPSLPRGTLPLPSPLRRLGDRLSAFGAGRGPFAVGILGGLMPCGPLQTMQLYALGTGSAAAGALSMFLFSIGTVPLMLAFGATAALLPRKFMPMMIKASSILVLLLGTLTLGRAAALAGVLLPSLGGTPIVLPTESSSVFNASLELPQAPAASPGIPGGPDGAGLAYAVAGSAMQPAVAQIKDGIQTVVTIFNANSYQPFYVQAGIPVRWIIQIKKEDITGCNHAFIVPSYGIRRDLKPGDNIVEFTPKAAGVVPYSCWMGMIRSAFAVVPDLGAVAGKTNSSYDPASGPGALAIPHRAQAASGLQVAGQAMGTPASLEGGRLPLDTIGVAKIKGGTQVVTVRVDGTGYTPAAVVVQRGMKTVISFEASALDGCNSIVFFPEYNGTLDLSKGEFQTPEIPVEGDFTFQCGMNMLHGYVKAVDDIAKVDLGAVRRELADYRAPESGCACCGN
ncbi:MAG: sulfite exporter TauE/SafE family protein [Rectinemataceae bacterium]